MLWQAYAVIYILGVMGKLSSKYPQMKITLTSHIIRYIYQNYMKMSRNTMDWIYLEIAIGFNSGLLMTLDSGSFSNVLLVSIAKCYLCLQFILGVAQNFVGLFLNLTQPIIIKGIVILGVMQLDVKRDVVAEIFWQPRMGSPASVAWHKVLLPDVGFSSSYSLDLE